MPPTTRATWPGGRASGLEFGRPVRIGRNVWIGAAAFILPGVSIGDDALIGTGSAVTREVPADATASGNPARAELTRRRPTAPGLHWSRIPLKGACARPRRHRAAAGPGAARACRRADGGAGRAERLEPADPARGFWRFAALPEGRMEACLFLVVAERAASLPDRAAPAALLRQPVTDAGRACLLAGGAGAAAARDRTVCVCFSVGLAAPRGAILYRRLTSVAEPGAPLSAGTDCDSRIPELREILREVQARAA